MVKLGQTRSNHRRKMVLIRGESYGRKIRVPRQCVKCTWRGGGATIRFFHSTTAKVRLRYDSESCAARISLDKDRGEPGAARPDSVPGFSEVDRRYGRHDARIPWRRRGRSADSSPDSTLRARSPRQSALS